MSVGHILDGSATATSVIEPGGRGQENIVYYQRGQVGGCRVADCEGLVGQDHMAFAIVEGFFHAVIDGRLAGEYARPVGWQGVFDGTNFDALDVDQRFGIVVPGGEDAVRAFGANFDGAETGVGEHPDIFVQWYGAAA